MVTGNKQHLDPFLRKTGYRFGELIEGVAWDIVLIEKVATMNKKVRLDIDGMVHCHLKVMKDTAGTI
jgi:hypothetical protein